MKMVRNLCLVLSAVIVFACISEKNAAAQGTVESTGSGTGVYSPATGMYSTKGENSEFGQVMGTGRVELFGEPPVLGWQNFGRRRSKGNGSPKNEVLERTVTVDGTYYTRSKGVGVVELTPVFDDPNFTFENGPYTAEWVAEFEFVKGTGIFKGAKGSITVSAINDPFFLSDEEWTFKWTFEGDFRLRGK